MKPPVCVWYVSGDPDDMLWATKMAAERHARRLFPEESESRRYARIYFKEVHDE